MGEDVSEEFRVCSLGGGGGHCCVLEGLGDSYW